MGWLQTYYPACLLRAKVTLMAHSIRGTGARERTPSILAFLSPARCDIAFGEVRRAESRPMFPLLTSLVQHGDRGNLYVIGFRFILALCSSQQPFDLVSSNEGCPQRECSAYLPCLPCLP